MASRKNTPAGKSTPTSSAKAAKAKTNLTPRPPLQLRGEGGRERQGARGRLSSSKEASPHALTHVDAGGAIQMVDVSAKARTTRHAVARALLRCSRATRDALLGGTGKKGEAIATAKVAGVLAAKKTGDLIPLCHPLALDDVQIAIIAVKEGLQITATTRCTGPTGVEMEAMTAAAVAGLTLYDMGKAAERTMVLDGVCLLEKGGGKSGLWRR